MNEDPTRGSEGGADDEDAFDSDPGIDIHIFETEWAEAWEDARSDPAETLPVLDEIIARMLDSAGYHEKDPVTRAGDEREVIDRYEAVHEAISDGELDDSPGDVADAINSLREVYEALHAQFTGVADSFDD